MKLLKFAGFVLVILAFWLLAGFVLFVRMGTD